jgi:hypothetical protein
MAFPELVRSLPAYLQWVQFLPLVAFQALTIVGLCLLNRASAAGRVPLDTRTGRSSEGMNRPDSSPCPGSSASCMLDGRGDDGP